jgi:hypothetical protein
MFIAVHENTAFTGKTVEEVIDRALNSDVDSQDLNFLQWTWFSATPCKLTVKLEQIAAQKAAPAKT